MGSGQGPSWVRRWGGGDLAGILQELGEVALHLAVLIHPELLCVDLWSEGHGGTGARWGEGGGSLDPP